MNSLEDGKTKATVLESKINPSYTGAIAWPQICLNKRIVIHFERLVKSPFQLRKCRVRKISAHTYCANFFKET